MTSLVYASVICAKCASHSKAFQCRSHSPSSSEDLHNRALIKSRTSFAKIADAAELSLLLGVMALLGMRSMTSPTALRAHRCHPRGHSAPSAASLHLLS